jgi:crotonobetainyl-CoA:carnitine CoA-transferase CaiB-like acyl-CoA transferase
MLLADLGATVVKVEGPGPGDDTRTWVPPTAADGTASYYLSINRNKRSVVLDLTDEDDAELARRWPPGPTSWWRTSSPAGSPVRARPRGGVRGEPAIVYCSISGFGTAGAPRCPATTCWCRRCPG